MAFVNWVETLRSNGFEVALKNGMLATSFVHPKDAEIGTDVADSTRTYCIATSYTEEGDSGDRSSSSSSGINTSKVDMCLCLIAAKAVVQHGDLLCLRWTEAHRTAGELAMIGSTVSDASEALDSFDIRHEDNPKDIQGMLSLGPSVIGILMNYHLEGGVVGWRCVLRCGAKGELWLLDPRPVGNKSLGAQLAAHPILLSNISEENLVVDSINRSWTLLRK